MEAQNKICQNCKGEFTIESNDFGFYEKMKVSAPTFCPDCRRQRRLAWKNIFYLYNRTCDLCSKPTISIYSKQSGIVVYCNKCWWSDKWDPKSYGVDYDFSRPFFEQYNELMHKVPHMALINDDGIASVNCEYTNDFAFGKNCYMTFTAWKIENALYSYFALAGKDMMDCTNIMDKSEWIYECIRCSRDYNVKYSQFAYDCIDSQFLNWSGNCSNCFMCIGIFNKKYYFKNKQYSKEEYEKILASYELDTFSGVKRAQKDYDDFILASPRRYATTFQVENCTGDNISRCKNVKDSFMVRKSENCRFSDMVAGIKDSYDMSSGGDLSECYDSVTCDNSSRNMFGLFSWKSQDVQYTQHCHSSKDLFGCASIRNGKHCIFNKQYTKEEYEELILKITAQMNDMPYKDKKGNVYKYGEYFPAELSPFGYNETIALEQHPLTKEQAINEGYGWQDNPQRTTGKETIKTEDIAESIYDVKDDILNEVLACVECKRNYKIVPNELIFYRKTTSPVPRKCFYCRYNDRLKRQNPWKLWRRSCMCTQNNHNNHTGPCKEEFDSSYDPNRPEIIYCEKCYQVEVY